MKENEVFYYKSNRLQQLRGFYYTAMLGSVSDAAEKMGLQQCSVSMQIKSLERDLEVNLFERAGPKMNISEAGHQLYELISPHIESIDSLPSAFQKKLKEKQEKKLTIAANQASFNYLLPRLISHCKESIPELSIRVKMENPSDGLELLKKDKIQAYIAPFSELPPEFEFHEICSAEVIIIAQKDHPLITSENFHISDIGKYQTVRTPDVRFFTVPFFEETLRQHKVKVYAEVENIDWEICKSFICHTDTFTIVSDICYDPKRDHNIGKRSLKELIPNMRYGIVIKKGKIHSEPVKHLLESAKNP